MARIVIIEDDPKFARLAEKILAVHGHTVIHGSTALMGLNIIEAQGCDLVLVDMDLPDLDGKVVAATIRGRSSIAQVPIIAVTAQNDAVTRRLALAFGCNGFIPKPIDTRKFPEQVSSFLRNR